MQCRNPVHRGHNTGYQLAADSRETAHIKEFQCNFAACTLRRPVLIHNLLMDTTVKVFF